MKQHASCQYTIRNVPANVDKALRKKAKESGLSLNETAVIALTSGVGEQLKPERDLSFMIGSMSSKEATRVETEIEMQRKIDADLW